MFLLTLACTGVPFELNAVAGDALITIELFENSVCKGNRVRMSDISRISGQSAIAEKIASTTLAPSPVVGESSTLSKSDIQAMLAVRGYSVDQLNWTGSHSVVVSRPRNAKSADPDELSNSQELSGLRVAESESTIDVHTLRAADSPTSMQSKMPLLSPQIIAAAQRNLDQAIAIYIESLGDDSMGYEVRSNMPPQLIKVLSQRHNLLEISGGHSPWTGSQKFVVTYRDPDHKLPENARDRTNNLKCELLAEVTLPPEVWGITAPVAKGKILEYSDLRLIRMNSSHLAINVSDCFTDYESIVGKESRKALSTGQILLKRDIGSPRVVFQNESIDVQVTAGSIVATTIGRAIQSGSIDDVIQVEIIATKKRAFGKSYCAGMRRSNRYFKRCPQINL